MIELDLHTGPSRVYAGIGSRETPSDVLELMERFAEHAARLGWTLRTGRANGADTAFENGARRGGGKIETFLPWPSFGIPLPATLSRPTPAAYRVSAAYHPAWARLSGAAKSQHARNAHIVLGTSLQAPAAFVLCWTRDGAQSTLECGYGTGGTGQGIRIADAYDVPVFSLARTDVLEAAERLLPTPD